MNDLLLRLRARIPDGASDEMLMELLTDAESLCLGYLGREKMPEACESALLRCACALYNRLGMEGESSHSEGGVAIVADGIPSEVRHMLAPYRLARTVG